MLLELCVGDCYGAEFEFSEDKYVEKYNHARVYFPDPMGIYTDDTQMSLAIAEALLEDDPWTPETLAERFVQAFKRDPRFGYSKRFYGLLTSVSNGSELLEKIEPTRDSCGCVMRAVPLGVIKDKDEMLRKAEIQARITHDVDVAVQCTQAIALISHQFLHYNMRPNLIRGMLMHEFPDIDWSDWSGKVMNKAVDVVRAVVTVLSNNTNYHDILRASVAFTGDTDSVASVAMGCAACSPYYKADMNEGLLYIENGEYGGDYLIELDKQLSQKFGVDVSGLLPLTSRSEG